MRSPRSHASSLAESLREAEAGRKPIPPLTLTHPTIDVAAAYEIQRINIEQRLRSGRRIVGRKVGLTSKAMQEMLCVSEPDFGTILDDMLVDSGGTIDTNQLIQPRVEAEIAFVLEGDLTGPGVDTETALRAIREARGALEVIDSRIEDWRITLADTVADNASSARVVLGSRGLPVRDFERRLAGVVLSRNGEVAELGVGAAALGDPLACVAWLANKLGEFGEGLRAGDVVMPGALHRAVEVSPGDAITAEFAWLGDVSVRFSKIEGESA